MTEPTRPPLKAFPDGWKQAPKTDTAVREPTKHIDPEAPKRVGPTDMQLRKSAMDYATANRTGLSYNPDGKECYDPDKLIEAATKIAAFLKGNGNDF